MIRVLVLCGLAALTALGGTCAKAEVAARARIAPHNPSVVAFARGVRSEQTKRDLDIRRMDLRVQLRGVLAVSQLNLWVHGKSSEPVEGQVGIALPAGSVITGYALDVDGAMVDGSLVEAARAEAAFDRQVRGQIDPGLAAVDSAGTFSTRIFPIDQAKGRRLTLRFTTPIGDGYRLPIDLAAPVDGWTVVVSGDAADARLGGVPLPRTGADTFRTGNTALTTELTIAAPRPPIAIASRHATGETYWQLSGALPDNPVPTGGTMRIYWDRSRSRRDADHLAELTRVREAVTALAPERIELVAFSSGAADRAAVTTFAEVERRVRALSYLGATSFAALAGGAPVQTCLLVSDGQVTLDEGRAVPPPCRLFAIAAAKGSNLAKLTSLAQATGGKVVAATSPAVNWRGAAVQQVLDASGKSLTFRALPSAAGQWALAIQAPDRGPVRVIVGGQVTERQPSTTPVAFDGEGVLLAEARLADLGGPGDRTAFVALSRRYGVASPTLSFVVLERPEDYIASAVAPPAGYKRQAAWAELKLADDANRAAARNIRFDQLLTDWKAQVAWYETSFDIAARPVRPELKQGRAPPAAVMVSPSIPGSPPPPPPPPPPPAAERDGDDDGAADIVVTGSRTAAEQNDSANIVVADSRPPQANALAQTDVMVSVDAWRPDRDYLDAYDKAPASFDAIYPEWERKAGGVPAFYLDTADWLFARKRTGQAGLVLMSALDLPTANQVTLGMVAARLERYGEIDAAVALRERQALLDPDRPQPKRLLALVLAHRARLKGSDAKADLQRAIGLLMEIALQPLDDNWSGIDLISLVEANDLLVRLRALGGDLPIDPRLVHAMPSDIRIVIDWSNDATDIDLWVDEPNSERAIYSNPRTRIGGHLSNDMTQGFGPEEYLLRRAAPGAYVTRAHVFAPDRLDPNGAARVTAHLYRDWGRPAERVQAIDFDVSRGKEGEIRIGTLTADGPRRP